MLPKASANVLQQWLQQHYQHHDDFRYLKIQCLDEQGLFWHRRHLNQQTPKKPLKARFIKHMPYTDIQCLNVTRIDGHLVAPMWLYPQPLQYGILLTLGIVLFLLGMPWALHYVPASYFDWLYPAVLSMFFFTIHEQFFTNAWRLWQSHKTKPNVVPKTPKWLKMLLHPNG